MKSFEELAHAAYKAYLKGAVDQQKQNPNLWVHDQPSWPALNREVQICWIAAVKEVAALVKNIH